MELQKDSTRSLGRPYRKAVLKALLNLTIFAGVLFSALNLQKGRWELALAEIGMVLFAIFVMQAIRKTEHLERWAIIFLLPFCATMLFSMMLPTSSVTVFGWVLIIPILSHLLLGRHLGLILSGIFMTLTAALFLYKHQDQPEMLAALPIANTVLIGICILAFSHVYEVTRERSELRLLELAQTDALTGLPNRIRLKESFERECKRASRDRTPFSLIVLDLDHFKTINDDYGHEAGDLLLRRVADTLRQCLRASDLPARLGGEEFGVLLTNTNTAQAAEVSEKIRSRIESMEVGFEGQALKVTVSGGIAELGVDGDSLRSLLREADNRMYEAKAAGRNQVMLPPSAELSPDPLAQPEATSRHQTHSETPDH
ncbi:GGDEF domain-containing protein [Marinobacter confluentis]|uniref:diguanylate cyclase n=1 Tax=Marinobacter confluentis TaxID=1697557 RepID=A0A4Z1BXD6_9GAMM|nr:GGDEF domain-containing protein [Marinobacter confluentis]TGN39280.1 GGDEF domain-containing protein [Marinobacter confluentis]